MICVLLLLCWQSSGVMAQVPSMTNPGYVPVNSQAYVYPTLIGQPPPVVPNRIPNTAISDLMTGPWWLDRTLRPLTTRDTFVQEFYYFQDIPIFNPYALVSPSGGYRFLENQLP
jgi:hypothetical protein